MQFRCQRNMHHQKQEVESHTSFVLSFFHHHNSLSTCSRETIQTKYHRLTKTEWCHYNSFGEEQHDLKKITNVLIYEKFKNLRGHGSFKHPRTSSLAPKFVQSFPPYFGDGFAQSRCLVFVPLPQETEHSVQVVHEV